MRRRIAALGCLLALAAGGCAPRPEEPEGGYCVYYSALSDRFAPLPLDCEPFEGSGGDPIPALVDALLSPPETQGLTSPFPEGVRLLSWEVEEGRLHLDLSEQYGGLSGVEPLGADALLTHGQDLPFLFQVECYATPPPGPCQEAGGVGLGSGSSGGTSVPSVSSSPSGPSCWTRR